MKKIICFLLTFAMLLNICPTTCYANTTVDEYVVYVDGVEFVFTLNEEFELEMNAETDMSTAYMIVGADGNAEVVISPKLAITDKKYLIDIEEMDSENLDATVYQEDVVVADYECMEDLMTDEYEGQASFVIGSGVVIAFDLILRALIQLGLLVIIAGIVYIVATTFIQKVKALSAEKRRQAQSMYYPAIARGDVVLILPKGMTVASAAKRLRARESVYSFTASMARAAITKASFEYYPANNKGEINSIKRSGYMYFYHYHKAVNGNAMHDNSHSFYGNAVIG